MGRRNARAQSLWAWHSMWGRAASLCTAVQASCEGLQGAVLAAWQSAIIVTGKERSCSAVAHQMIDLNTHASSMVVSAQCILAWRYWVVDHQGHVHHFSVLRLGRCLAAWRRITDQGMLYRRCE